MRWQLSVVGVMLISALVGCATTQLYDGPARPSDQVVRINGMSGLDPLGGLTSALVCKIDDREIDGCAVKVEFLPGVHRLELKTKRYGITEGTDVIEQEFKAGERYLLGIRASPGARKLMPALIPDRRR